MDYYRPRRDGRLSWLTVYPQSGHPSIIDRTQGRESLPAKNRRPNNWATPATCGPE